MIFARIVMALLVTSALGGVSACDPPRRAPLPDRLVVTGGWNDNEDAPEKAKFMAVLDGFTDETGIPVSYREPRSASELGDTLRRDIAAGHAPDVAFLPQPGLLKTLARCPGVLTPLPDAVEQIAKANYSDLWLGLGEVDHKPYGLVFKVANKSLVWYDANAFSAANVTPPATWPDFLAAARVLANGSGAAMAIAGKDQWVLTDWFENIYLRQAGPQKYDQLAEHTIPWTDPSVSNALQKLGELWGDAALVAPTPSSLSLNDAVKQVFDQHNAAMVFEGDFLTGRVAGYVGSSGLGVDAKVFDFPAFQPGQQDVIVGGDTAVITRNSPNAVKLMGYLASAKAVRIWAARGGLVSANKNVSAQTYPDQISRQSAAELPEAKVVRFDLSDLLPPDLGSTQDAGLWSALHDLAAKPPEQRRSPGVIKRTLDALEQRAHTAYTRPANCPGS